jgi:hypothetical protein
MNSEIENDFAALEYMRRARMSFATKLGETSASQQEEILEVLRLDSMFEFAEFFFTMAAMGLDGAEDIVILAEMHNQRIVDLVNDEASLRRRKLRKDRLLKAIFTSDTRPRLEQTWRESPGSMDQSNLARFLGTQMSTETTRQLVMACEAAGFLTRRTTSFGTVVIASTGTMEKVFCSCMREMRLAMAQL